MDGSLTGAMIHKDVTREDLLRLCDASVVRQDHWQYGETWRSQAQLGELTVLLDAGAGFMVTSHTGPGRRSDLYYVVVWFRGIPWFRDGGDDRSLTRHEYFLPKLSTLDQLAGKDWH